MCLWGLYRKQAEQAEQAVTSGTGGRCNPPPRSPAPRAALYASRCEIHSVGTGGGIVYPPNGSHCTTRCLTREIAPPFRFSGGGLGGAYRHLPEDALRTRRGRRWRITSFEFLLFCHATEPSHDRPETCVQIWTSGHLLLRLLRCPGRCRCLTGQTCPSCPLFRGHRFE